MKFILTIFFFQYIAWASPSKHLHVNEGIINLQKKYANIDKKIRGLEKRSFLINKKLNKIKNSNKQAEQRIYNTTKSVKRYVKLLKKLDGNLKDQKHFLQERLKVIHRWRDNNILEFVSTASSIGELDRRMKALIHLTRSDIQLLRNYKKNRIKFSNNKNILKSKLLQLQNNKKKLAKSQNNYQGLIKLLSSNMKKLENLKKKQISQLKNLRRQGYKKQNIVEEKKHPIVPLSFIEKKGKLSLPIFAEVSKNFGYKKSKNSDVVIFDKGLLFHSVELSNVFVVAKGKVEYVGKIPGYSNTVVVNHGQNYYSIYSHLNKIQVKHGQELWERQLIAKVGKGRKLYFELRHFSNPVNPNEWFENPLKIANTINSKRASRRY